MRIATEHDEISWARSDRIRDGIAAGVLFVVSFALGTWFASHWGGKADFYQVAFGPAVRVACGGEFAASTSDFDSAVSEFLVGTRQSFSCADLEPLESLPLNNLQASSRYLMYSVATIWRLRGISWSSLGPLYGFFFAVVIGCAYVVLRVSLRRPIAVPLALLLATSPTHLMYLPHLRDYSKAPFMMVLFVILVLLVMLPLKPRRFVVCCALYGAILGLGIGFRHDLQGMALPFFVTVVWFLPAGLREAWLLRTKGGAAFLVAFLVIGWPILSNPLGTRGLWFVVNHGFMEPFDEILEVGNDLYSRGHMYHDTYLGIDIQGFSHRTSGNTELLEMGSSSYEKATFDYFLETLGTFPADAGIRAYAASLKILDLPFSPSTFSRDVARQFGRPEDVRIDSRVVRACFSARERLVTLLRGAGFFFMVIALFLLRTRIRVALFTALVFTYFTTYPALQFQPRHFFHLEFIGWWALGFTVQELLQRRPASLRRLARDLLVFGAIVFTVIGVPLAVARTVQERRLRTLFDQYLTSPGTNVWTAPTPLGEGRVFFSVAERSPEHYVRYRLRDSEGTFGTLGPGIGESADTRFHEEILRVTIDPSRIREDRFISVAFRYVASQEARNIGYDPTLRIDVPIEETEGPIHLIVPVREILPYSRFAGLEVAEAHAASIVAIEGLDDPGRFPLMVRATLPSDWRNRPLYQTLRIWSPNPVTALAANVRRPRHVINQWVGGWILLGFDVEPAIVDGLATSDVELHWLAPPDFPMKEHSTLRRAGGNHWIQTVPGVRNVVADGGFENEGTLRFFPGDDYSSDKATWAGAEQRQLRRDERNDRGWIATLRHADWTTRSSFASIRIAVQEDHLYLQSAELRCTNCRVHLGWKWMNTGTYRHFVTDANPSRWANYASVFRPPPGTDAIQIWMLSLFAKGEADFDNVLLLDLGRISRSFHPTEPPVELAESPAPIARFPLRRFLNGWQLTGYDADSRRLAAGMPVDVTLHWIAPPWASPRSGRDLRACGKHCWMQTLHGVRNMVPHGDFEEGDLAFYPRNIYGAPWQDARIVEDPEKGRYAELSNESVSRSSLVSSALSIKPGSAYIQSGRFVGPDAGIIFGHAEVPSGRTTYIARDFAPRSDTRLDGVFVAGREASGVQLWILNYDASGVAGFDDVVLAELGPIVPCHQGSVSCGPPIGTILPASDSISGVSVADVASDPIVPP